MINELGCSRTRSENVYFANNERASTAATSNEHYLIKLKLYNNWSAQLVNSISECTM